MTVDVAIVNSGGANIASLTNALDRINVGSRLTTDAHEIQSASHVILPGVGAAADAMKKLQQLELTSVIRDLTQPVLGICLGMQLLVESSDEDNAICLGILSGTAKALRASPRVPVPHMGWSQILFDVNHPLLDGIIETSYFYFLHSYAVPPAEYTIATADHGVPFSAILAERNFFAAQFHPERSSVAGSRLLQNFVRL